jgi:hypothetical protein
MLRPSVVRPLAALPLCGLYAAMVGCASRAPIMVEQPPGIIVERADHGAAALRGSSLRRESRTTDFWEAIADLDLDAATKHAVARGIAGDPGGEEQRRLVEALRQAIAGRSAEADSALRATLRMAEDSSVRRVARLALTATLQYAGDWPALAALTRAPADPSAAASYAARTDSSAATASANSALVPTLDGADPGRVKASVEAWARAFRGLPAVRFAFPSAPVTLELTRSATGVPMIPVRVNGRPYRFWLDTGSSLTILSSAVAADAGVAPLVPDTLEAVTATGRVAARPAVVKRLELGALTIDDNSAMIVDSEDLVLSRGDSGRVYVDGIIGFDAIRRLDLELDYPAGVATIRRPATPDSAAERQRNLFWLGYPLVRLAAADGTPVHFGLDTGAQESYAAVPLLVKTHARTYLGERKDVGGFGKELKVQGRFIPRLRLKLRDTPLRLERVFVYVTQSPTFFAIDGMLGGDVGAGGVVRIDMTNGVFAVRRSAGRGAKTVANNR